MTMPGKDCTGIRGQSWESHGRERRTLVGPDGSGELDAVAAVHVLLACVVHPRHAELDHPLGLHQARLFRHRPEN